MVFLAPSQMPCGPPFLVSDGSVGPGCSTESGHERRERPRPLIIELPQYFLRMFTTVQNPFITHISWVSACFLFSVSSVDKLNLSVSVWLSKLWILRVWRNCLSYIQISELRHLRSNATPRPVDPFKI